MTFPFVDPPHNNAQYFTIHKEMTATFKTICQGEGEESWNCHQAEASTKKSSKTKPKDVSARTLSDQTVEPVKEWYRSDEISCVMPGMKDFISVKIEDRQMQVQKRLILCNL